MPHWRRAAPLWSAGMEATLCIHTCLWLSAPWIPLASGGQRAPDTEGRHAKLTWAVSLDAPEEELEQRAEELARTAGLVNMGRVGELKGHYLFAYQPEGRAAPQHEAIRRAVDALFAQHDSVRWHSEQKLLKRSKRSLHFNDPKYPQQWHLNNHKSPGKDINVTGVWERNVTGRGVTVVVVDDGVEHTIKDIQPNYCPEGSYDLNSNDPDPMPHPDEENGNHHGTRCAGEIAAVPNNSFCTVGVAYGSRIAGIRVLDGPLTDSMEAIAFNKHYQINDIYSCSWGPDDDGKTVDGPHQLGKRQLEQAPGHKAQAELAVPQQNGQNVPSSAGEGEQAGRPSGVVFVLIHQTCPFPGWELWLGEVSGLNALPARVCAAVCLSKGKAPVSVGLGTQGSGSVGSPGHTWLLAESTGVSLEGAPCCRPDS